MSRSLPDRMPRHAGAPGDTRPHAAQPRTAVLALHLGVAAATDPQAGAVIAFCYRLPGAAGLVDAPCACSVQGIETLLGAGESARMMRDLWRAGTVSAAEQATSSQQWRGA